VLIHIAHDHKKKTENITLKGIFRNESDIKISEEGPFPSKTLLSKRDTPTASVKIGSLPVGGKIEVHSHKDVNQLEYYIKGKATLFLEGVGEKEIRPGTFMFAPKGVKHGIHSVTEELIIYCVFTPALF